MLKIGDMEQLNYLTLTNRRGYITATRNYKYSMAYHNGFDAEYPTGVNFWYRRAGHEYG